MTNDEATPQAPRPITLEQAGAQYVLAEQAAHDAMAREHDLRERLARAEQDTRDADRGMREAGRALREAAVNRYTTTDTKTEETPR